MWIFHSEVLTNHNKFILCFYEMIFDSFDFEQFEF